MNKKNIGTFRSKKCLYGAVVWFFQSADARSDLPARNSEDTKDYGDKMAKTSFSSNKGTAKEGGFVADLSKFSEKQGCGIIKFC